MNDNRPEIAIPKKYKRKFIRFLENIVGRKIRL